MPSAQPNPLNLYGITKRDAELAVLGVEGAHVIVLRVPVLYVLVSAVYYNRMSVELMLKCIVDTAQLRRMQTRRSTSLVDVVRDQSGKKYTMDHYQTRFPTKVLDIAGFLVRLASMNACLSSLTSQG